MEQPGELPNNGNASLSSLRHDIYGKIEGRRVQLPPQSTTSREMEGTSSDANVLSGPPNDSATSSEKPTSRNHAPASSVVEEAACGVPAYVFQIHAARAVDPLIGEVVVCPQTLEALCLHRMFGFPFSFTWEQIPPPYLSWCGGVPSMSRLPLAIAGPALPAAVDPKTGMVMSGCSLLEALRSFAQSHVRVQEVRGAACCAEARASVRGEPVTAEGELKGGGRFCKCPLCMNTCGTRSRAAVEQATEFALTELVQQAVGRALRFYLWKDEATFRNFTRPLLQNTFGRVYGSYYCWAVRRSMGGAAADCSSPRVLPEDLRRQYPSFDDCGATHDALTMEELLAVDGVRRALRVVEQLLQGKPFFGGSTTNALDAVVFAHLAILFSLPLPDRRELQRVLLNAGSLVQYCRRVQEAHQIWPSGPSFLFGVLSLSEVARGTPLCVHSWRQKRVNSRHGNYEEEMECSNEEQGRWFWWWLGTAACCAVSLVAAGKTPFRMRRTRLIRSP